MHNDLHILNAFLFHQRTDTAALKYLLNTVACGKLSEGKV